MVCKKQAILEPVNLYGAEMILPFPLIEYENRLKNIRKAMAEGDIDLLYVTMPEHLFYVSGYNCSWFRGNSPQSWYDTTATGLAIHVNHDKFILFECPDEDGLLACSSASTDTRIFYDIPATGMYGKEYKTIPQGMSFIDMIVKNLKEEGWMGGKTAIEMGSYRPNRITSEKLHAALEAVGCEVVDGTEIIRGVRSIKSPAEMRYIEKAAQIADIGMQAVANTLRPGMTELDVVAEYTYAMYKAGGENSGIVNLTRSGQERVWWFHASASRKVIMPGDPVLVDLCGVYNRYHANQWRGFSAGQPDVKFMIRYEKAKKIMIKLKETIKPNMYVKDFWKEMMKFYQEEGLIGQQYWIGGYEMGICFPPDWVGSFVYDPYLDTEDQQFLPGMAVNFVTGFGISDTIIFTEKDAKILGSTTWDLQVVNS